MLSPPRALAWTWWRRRGPDIPAADPPVRLRFRDGRDPGDDAGDAGFRRLARSRVAGRLRHHDHDRHNETVEVGNWRHIVGAVGASALIVGGLYLLQPNLRRPRQSQSADLLRRHRGGASCLPGCRSRSPLALPRSATRRSPRRRRYRGRRRADRGRDVPSDPAVGPTVRLPRAADRDDGHGARDDQLPREPAGACARRPVLCADRRDVSRFRNFRLQGSRHGCDRAGAVSRK